MQFSVWRAGKKLADRTGDVLFTHLGLSGPGILDASRDIHPDDVIKLSFVGNLKREEFVADLTKACRGKQELADQHDTCCIPDPGTPQPETSEYVGNTGRSQV